MLSNVVTLKVLQSNTRTKELGGGASEEKEDHPNVEKRNAPERGGARVTKGNGGMGRRLGEGGEAGKEKQSSPERKGSETKQGWPTWEG